MIRRATQSRQSRRGGFTLVEVLVTMALMGIVLPVAMRGMSLAVATAGNARHKAEAAVLAQTKLAEISQAVLVADTTNENSSGDFSEVNPMFTIYQWTSSALEDSTLGLTELTVTVVWNERGQQKSLSLSTLVVTPS